MISIICLLSYCVWYYRDFFLLYPPSTWSPSKAIVIAESTIGDHEGILRLVNFIVKSIKDPNPKQATIETVKNQFTDLTISYEELRLKYTFLSEDTTSTSSYFRNSFLHMLRWYYSTFVLIHKEKKATDGAINPRLIVPESDDRFPPWSENATYRDAYEDLYREVTRFLSESITFLLFCGAQHVVLAREGRPKKILFGFPSPKGYLGINN